MKFVYRVVLTLVFIVAAGLHVLAIDLDGKVNYETRPSPQRPLRPRPDKLQQNRPGVRPTPRPRPRPTPPTRNPPAQRPTQTSVQNPPSLTPVRPSSLIYDPKPIQIRPTKTSLQNQHIERPTIQSQYKDPEIPPSNVQPVPVDPDSLDVYNGIILPKPNYPKGDAQKAKVM